MLKTLAKSAAATAAARAVTFVGGTVLGVGFTSLQIDELQAAVTAAVLVLIDVVFSVFFGGR